MCNRSEISNKLKELLEKVKNVDSQFLFELAGDTGLEIKNFSELVSNSDREDLDDLHQKNHDLFLEILKIADYSKKNNLNLALNQLSKLLKNINIEKTRVPKFSNQFARFRSDKAHVRLSKKSWKFSSNYFSNSIESIWNETPDDFIFFEKNKIISIESIKQKRNRYKAIGCEDLAEALDKYIKNVDSESYYGYKKININVAICILAKINNIKTKEYQPCIYSFFEFENFAPKKVKNDILLVENLANSFFDHHLILVPSFKDHTKDADAQFLMDRTKKSLVLGEKDGTLFYISIWQPD